MTQADYQFAEDIAALGINFGFSKYYERVRDAVGGNSADFYSAAIHAAMAMELVVKRERITWGENAEWPLSIDNFSDAIMGYALRKGNFPSHDEFEQLAKDSIDWAV